MRHKIKGKKLNRDSNHRKMMIRTMIKQLVEHGFIKTTLSKAKLIGVEYEKLINKSKTPNLNHIRKLVSTFGNKKTAFDIIELAKTTKRKSGLTKILRFGRRQGDNAMMVQLEIIEKLAKKEPEEKKKEDKKEKNKKPIKKSK